jgi:exopolysaccharide biosynthesis polyprenyl glycosylphosphotransferase
MAVIPQVERPRPRLPTAASLPKSHDHAPIERHPARRTEYVRLVRAGDMAVGLIALLGGFLAANLGRMPAGLQEFLEMRLTVRNLLLIGTFALAWHFLGQRAGLYDPRRIRGLSLEIWRVALVCAAGMAAAMIFPLISRTGAFSPSAVLYFGAVAGTGLVLLRLVLRTITATGAPDVREILIVGSGPRARRAYLELHRDQEGSHRFLGFVDTHDHSASEEIRRLWAGSLPDLETILMGRAVDEVLIALPIRSMYSEIQGTIEICSRMGVRCRYLADVFDHGRARPRLEHGDRFSTVDIPVAPDDGRLVVKRAVDVTGTLLGALLLWPLFLCAAVAIKLTSPGPILFSQERHGLHKRRFRMYKFRTMVMDAESRQAELEATNEASGAVFKIRKDPRITPLGRILRRTSIDELPQLWNVLRGDMSLVGPRPLPLRDVGRFTEAALLRRFSVRPGLTGLWQISGRSDVTFERWMELDLQYIDQWSLGLDLRIIAGTIPAVIKATGAA